MNTMLLLVNVLFAFSGIAAMEKTVAKEFIDDSAYADTSERLRQISQRARAPNAADVEKQKVAGKRSVSGESDSNKRTRIESEKDTEEIIVAKTSTQEELNKELWKALRSGLTRESIHLLKEGADHTAGNMVGDTPLHMAIRKGMKNAIKELIERGADITAVNNKNETPLIAAEPDMALFVEELIKEHNNAVQHITSTPSLLSVNQKNAPDELGMAHRVSMKGQEVTAQSTMALDLGYGSLLSEAQKICMTLNDDDVLMTGAGNSISAATQLPFQTSQIASNTNKTSLEEDLFTAAANGDVPRLKNILARGISYKVKSPDFGYTILHRAAYGNHLATIQWIIATYPDLIEEVTTKVGNTVLHVAARGGHLEVVKWLMSSHPALINKQNHEKATIFHLAVGSGCLPLVQYLVKECPHCVSLWVNGNSILHVAAAWGKTTVLRWLIEHYPELRTSVTMDNGYTIVHSAALKNGTIETLRFVAEVCPELMLTPDRKYGATCLHHAVSNSKPDMVQWLVEKYPSLVVLKSKNGSTPLDLAKRYKNENLIAILTRAYGKQAQSSNTINTNALVSSVTLPRLDQSEGEQLQSSHGIYSSNQASDLELLSYVDVHKKINGMTVLHKVLSQNSAFMRQLLEMGADINTQDDEGKTVLMKAIGLKDNELIRLLLSKNGNVDIQNNAGETALILAAKEGLLPIVTLLLEKGADIVAKDLQGNTFITYLDPGIQGLVSALVAK